MSNDLKKDILELISLVKEHMINKDRYLKARNRATKLLEELRTTKKQRSDYLKSLKLLGIITKKEA